MTESEADDREWCSIHGYDIPREHVCGVGVCYNPCRDGQELQGTLADRFAAAKELIIELRSW